MTTRLRVLSLGAGVQSSTLYLMACGGHFGMERPDLAVFADTQWEPGRVYEHLNFLEGLGGSVVPIVRTTAGSIRTAALTTRVNPRTGRRSRVVSLPVFVRNEDGSGGMLNRQCTRDFKIRPIRRAVRAAMLERGISVRPGVVEQWIGITTDEADRVADSGVQYITNRHPLIELDWDREDCERWLAERGITAPKSACIGCPYVGDDRWRHMRDEEPSEWEDAIRFDAAIRNLPEVNGRCYLHSSLEPLGVAKLTRRRTKQLRLGHFGNECTGMCGV